MVSRFFHLHLFISTRLGTGRPPPVGSCLGADVFTVIWIPDEGLRAIHPDEDFGAAQILKSLEDFQPEQWGLPTFSQ